VAVGGGLGLYAIMTDIGDQCVGHGIVGPLGKNCQREQYCQSKIENGLHNIEILCLSKNRGIILHPILSFYLHNYLHSCLRMSL